MQKRPTNQSADAKMQPVPATSITTSMIPPDPFASFKGAASPVSTTRKGGRRRGLFLRLFLLGMCVEGLYLALFPLLAGNDPQHNPLFQAWRAFLPWLPQWHWTEWVHLTWLDPGTSVGNANLLIVVLSLTMLAVLLAAQIARLQWNKSPQSQHACAWLVLLFTLLFALTILVSPPHLDIFSRDMVSSWLAGRTVVIYHANPYIVTPTAYPQDIATTLLSSLQASSSPDIVNLSHSPVGTTGPVGIDISILLSLFGHDQIANTLLSFRSGGVLLHLGNALLIWLILRKSKPEMSLPALVLYAWNPLILLLGVAQMHQELVTIFFVLLAIYFLQRDASVLSWFFLLLAALINFLCLLLLPLFIRIFIRKTRFHSSGGNILLWLGLLILSQVVLVLAYLPYWDGWGWNGLATNLSLVFLPSHALNSLDAMLLALPLPISTSNIFNPVVWSIILLSFMGLLLLFSFWLADTIALLLLCASWLLLIFLIFQPLYWPWYLLLPLALALCSMHGKTVLLTILLSIGALFSYYCWSRGLDWKVQGILVLGLPCLLWGWCIFLISTWRMMCGKQATLAEAREEAAQRPRSPWLSRPSWPSRTGKIRRPNSI
jgi:hypothetical protein